MYSKLAGMTGTAVTEAAEFNHIYKLDVVTIPTNKPLVRKNFPDVIYKTEKEKFNAVVNEIIELNKKGTPCLVGTISIEKSERLARFLKAKGIPHNVLNAKFHEMEATIVAQAGRFAGVTIATNMAGRGTDITLGGNAEYELKDLYRQRNIDPKNVSAEEYNSDLERIKARINEAHEKVVAAGGLHVIGTERHEARRIDNQLRGRSGRQGDPGSSKFFISLQDDLMRIFGSDRIAGIMDKLGMEEGQEIQHPFVSKAIETAQKRVEAYNFDIRKHLLEYDNVMNKQREVIYSERKKVLEGDDEYIKQHVQEITGEILDSGIDFYMNEHVRHQDIQRTSADVSMADASPEEGWDFDGLKQWIHRKFAMTMVETPQWGVSTSRDEIRENLLKEIRRIYDEKEKNLGPENLRNLERFVMLQVIDSRWKDHLYAMDNLRDGIGLRAYGQKDPLIEYQHEGYDMFTQMIDSIKEEITDFIFRVQAVRPERTKSVFALVPQKLEHAEATGLAGIQERQSARALEREAPEPSAPIHRDSPKVGRNDPCPCGSGKKYKKCHGA